MPTPSVSGNFGDLLDPRFQKIFNDRYDQLPDMLGKFFTMVSNSPTKADYRTSQMGTLGDVPEFTGTVVYDDSHQGYDGTITPKEYASGYQIERKLYDDDQFGVMDAKPRTLATAYQPTRQKHGGQLFNNAFSVDNTWNSYTENVALVSDSHTTTAPGVSTSTGFDNLVTTALSAVALAAARIQMINFRGDRAERISVVPNTILIPPDLYEIAYEIVESSGKVDTANNNVNVHKGKYDVMEWIYLTDVNNWFLMDSTMMKDSLYWFDRVQKEFAQVEDFDTLVAKWRMYARYGHGHNDWRWILGALVS